MADIAIVFHWQPAVMEAMSLRELLDWQRIARERSKPDE
ncbi:GpE family phage tail protein [Novosphingobium sp. EMRT-2]|nr:GpE family phage tail protein [Novosphingobium sp. EMRT-2]QCI92908.1 GpE family phage tail protein [Novosphingobium sp. EMRT-2]